MRQTTRQDTAAPVRMPSLDMLRIVAALAVVAYHYLYRGAVEGGYLDVSYGVAGDAVSLGYLGVNLFFMISGFVIVWSAAGRDWVSFASGRIIRLYPAHVVAMTLTALVTLAWSTPPYDVSALQYLANLTMLAPFFGQPFMDGAYWSIVLELIFYGWVTVALMAAVLPRRLEAFVIVWLAVIALNSFVIDSRALGLVFLTAYGACFAFGMMVWRIWSAGATPLRLVAGIAAFAMTFVSAERQRLLVLEDYGVASSATTVAFANLLLAAIFLAAIAYGRSGTTARWATFAAIAGGVSYPLYLVHQHAGFIVINATAPSIGKWPAAALALGLAVAASYLIFAYAEPVGRRLLRAVLNPLTLRLRPRRPDPHMVPAE
jgi:peptidoglycan/LPS O-acetylase OafA/YrhL